jgi:hypothetical protein
LWVNSRGHRYWRCFRLKVRSIKRKNATNCDQTEDGDSQQDLAQSIYEIGEWAFARLHEDRVAILSATSKVVTISEIVRMRWHYNV